jgi:hypothetical protein
MKHTEKEILELAKSILREIDFEYSTDTPLTARYNSTEALLKGKEDLKLFEEYKKIVKPYWTIVFDLPLEYDARIPSVYLDIYDETGIPFELQTWQAVYKFAKSPEDKWVIE